MDASPAFLAPPALPAPLVPVRLGGAQAVGAASAAPARGCHSTLLSAAGAAAGAAFWLTGRRTPLRSIRRRSGLAADVAAPTSRGAVALAATLTTAEPAETQEEEEEAAPPPPPPFNPADQPGVTEPLGYWDPLGFSKIGDEAGFRQFRSAELKHGRVSMMAAAGAVVQHYGRFPLFFDFVPPGLKAAYTDNGKYGFFFLMVAVAGLELIFWTEDPEKDPGDYGDPLGFNIMDTDMRNRELNNGRAAMFAALGIVVAELYTGKPAMEQLGLPSSEFMG